MRFLNTVSFSDLPMHPTWSSMLLFFAFFKYYAEFFLFALRLRSFSQFSCSVMSNSLRPHESQHARPRVHQKLPEFTQTHAHRVGDAIQPSHTLSSPSLPASNPSEHQRLFQRGSSSHEVAQVLGVSASAFPMSTQDWSPLGWTGWISLQSKGLSRVFSNTLTFILISRINLWFSFFDTVIILVCFLYQDNAIPLKYRGKCILFSYVVKRNIAKF